MKIYKAVERTDYPVPGTLKSMTRTVGRDGGVVYGLGKVTLPHPNHGPLMAFNSLEAAIDCAQHWGWDCEIYEGQAILDPVQSRLIAKNFYTSLYWEDRMEWLSSGRGGEIAPPTGTVFCKAVMLERPVAKVSHKEVYHFIYKVVRETTDGILKSAVVHKCQDGVTYDLEYSTRFYTRPEAGLLLAFDNRKDAEHFFRVENAVMNNERLYSAWGKVERRGIRYVSRLEDDYQAWWRAERTDGGMPVVRSTIGCSSIILIERLDE